jgi:hypothetical protein
MKLWGLMHADQLVDAGYDLLATRG